MACHWCCNPENQAPHPELAYFPDKCVACGRCATACPHGAVVIRDVDEASTTAMDEAGASPRKQREVVTDRSVCAKTCYRRLATCDEPTASGGPATYGRSSEFPCVKACLTGARHRVGRFLPVSEVAAEVLRDHCFYERTGGGVTVSGGEPLLQADFTMGLMTYLQDRWTDCAVETCGQASWPTLAAVARLAKLVYYDIKCIDARKHEEATGRPNHRILENAVRLVELARTLDLKVVIRTPIIPGFNASAEDVRAIARFVSAELRGAAGMELLPYHKLGRGKYASLGRPYLLADIQPPQPALMDELRDVVRREGIESIGRDLG